MTKCMHCDLWAAIITHHPGEEIEAVTIINALAAVLADLTSPVDAKLQENLLNIFLTQHKHHQAEISQKAATRQHQPNARFLH